MEVFFSISGYLITDIILSRSHRSANFYQVYFLRRVLRIWPLYFAVLPVACAFHYALWKVGDGQSLSLWPELLQTITFTQNLELLTSLGGNGADVSVEYPVTFMHAWSVAVEEQFYVVAAFALPWAVRTRYRGILAGILLVLPLGALVIRAAGAHPWLLISRMDGFALGGLLAIALHHRQLLPRVLADGLQRYGLRAVVFGLLLAGGAGGLIYALTSYTYDDLSPEWGIGATTSTLRIALATSAFAMLGTGCVGICVLNRDSRATKGLRATWLVHLGRISYSTYLWHIPIFGFAYFLLPKYLGIPSHEVAMLIAVPFVLAVSHVSWLLIERPFVRLGRQMKYSTRVDGRAEVSPGSDDSIRSTSHV